MTEFSDHLQAFLKGQQPLETLKEAINRELEQGFGGQVIAVLAAARKNHLLDDSIYQLLAIIVTNYKDNADTRITDLPAPSWMRHLSSQAINGIEIAPGSILNERFILDEIIGLGGMGIVFKASDLRKIEAQDREPHVAIKILSKEIQSHPQALIALQRESKKTQKLAHPNIVTVYDYDRDGDTVYMTMEYLEGEPLDHLIKREAALPRERALEIVTDISHGLAYAHKRGIVHSDLKPGNVYILKDGTAKILDFGIAHAVKTPGQTIFTDATVFNPRALSALTPAYASCEILEEGPSDQRDDIYALGCITHELLTGKHPYNRIPATAARDSIIKIRRDKRLTRNEWTAIQHALVFDQDSRTATVEKFQTELQPHSGIFGIKNIITVALLIASIIITSILSLDPFNTAENSETVTTDNNLEFDLVERLIYRAESNIETGNLIFPNDDNALDLYSKALLLDPSNTNAMKGIDAIKQIILKRIDKALQDGRLADSESLIQSILGELPNDIQLLEKQRQLEQLIIDLRLEKIGQHIAKAKEQSKIFHFTEPVDANAYQSLQQALKIDPENILVNSEIEGLVLKIIKHTRQLIKKHEWVLAREGLNEGLVISPKNLTILSLVDELNNEEEKIKSLEVIQNQVAALIVQSKMALSSGKIISPKEDNAVHYSHLALELIPDNIEAQSILQNAALTYHQIAVQHRNKKEWNKGLVAINTALQIDQVNESYIALKEYFKEKADSIESHTAEIEICQEHLKRNRLTTGKEGNAADCFKKVLILDPGNPVALKGMSAIETKYQGWATKALSNSQTNKFKDYLDKLEKLNPESDAIVALQNLWFAREASKITSEESFKSDHPILLANNKSDAVAIPPEKPLAISNAPHQVEKQVALLNFKHKPITVDIPGGLFQMGSTGGDANEKPVHEVKIEPFRMGKFEVTQAEWVAVMGSNPSFNKGCDKCPVERVTWDDAQLYIRKLREYTGLQYRLPTEAEWEYACRSGGKSEHYCGGSAISSLSWYEENSKKKTSPIGKKNGNGLSLYDMSGNVSEWTQDCWNKSYSGAHNNGLPWISGDCSSRVFRGGSWFSQPEDLRSTARSWTARNYRYGYGLGFRLAISINEYEQKIVSIAPSEKIIQSQIENNKNTFSKPIKLTPKGVKKYDSAWKGTIVCRKCPNCIIDYTKPVWLEIIHGEITQLTGFGAYNVKGKIETSENGHQTPGHMYISGEYGKQKYFETSAKKINFKGEFSSNKLELVGHRGSSVCEISMSRKKSWADLQISEEKLNKKIQAKIATPITAQNHSTHDLVKIPSGRFWMAPENEFDNENGDQQQAIEISTFFLGRYEVTQAQWKDIMGHNPSGNMTCSECPVDNVSWIDIQSYLIKLNKKSTQKYRLPTGFEWEYACRSGGNEERYCGGYSIDSYGWHDGNSGGAIHPVGQKEPNGLGLHDMSGNVSEWIQDCDTLKPASEMAKNRPNKSSNPCTNRILRGGSWANLPRHLRSVYRESEPQENRLYGNGFRLARD